MIYNNIRLIHAEGLGIILKSLHSDVTLFLHGLDSFIYCHPSILLKNESMEVMDALIPKVEVYRYRHSWRASAFFRQYLLCHLKVQDLFQTKTQAFDLDGIPKFGSYHSFTHFARELRIDDETRSKILKGPNRVGSHDFQPLLDFGELKLILKDSFRSDSKDFYYLISKLNSSPLSVDTTNLRAGMVQKYYLLRNEKSKTVFRMMPIISLSSEYLKLKSLFLEFLKRSNESVIEEFCYYRDFRHPAIFKYITDTFTEADEVHPLKKDKSFPSLDIFIEETDNIFSKKGLPVFMYKNVYESRPEMPEMAEKVSICGPHGLGLPFNNSTNKTYLFGKFYLIDGSHIIAIGFLEILLSLFMKDHKKSSYLIISNRLLIFL